MTPSHYGYVADLLTLRTICSLNSSEYLFRCNLINPYSSIDSIEPLSPPGWGLEILSCPHPG